MLISEKSDIIETINNNFINSYLKFDDIILRHFINIYLKFDDIIFLRHRLESIACVDSACWHMLVFISDHIIII